MRREAATTLKAQPRQLYSPAVTAACTKQINNNCLFVTKSTHCFFLPHRIWINLSNKQILEKKNPAIKFHGTMVFGSLLHVNWSSATEFQKKTPKNKIRSLLLNTFGRQEHTCFSCILWEKYKSNTSIISY